MAVKKAVKVLEVDEETKEEVESVIVKDDVKSDVVKDDVKSDVVKGEGIKEKVVKFSKSALLRSNKYSNERDIIESVIKNDEFITFEELEKRIDLFLKGGF